MGSKCSAPSNNTVTPSKQINSRRLERATTGEKGNHFLCTSATSLVSAVRLMLSFVLSFSVTGLMSLEVISNSGAFSVTLDVSTPFASGSSFGASFTLSIRIAALFLVTASAASCSFYPVASVSFLQFTCVLIKRFASADSNLGKQIHGSVVKFGYDTTSVTVVNSVNHLLRRCSGSIHDVCKVFDRISQRDQVSWNSLINALCKFEEWELALEAFRLMGLDGISLSTSVKQAISSKLVVSLYSLFCVLVLVKRKSVLPSSSLDQFLEKQRIHISAEKEHDIHIIDGVRVLPTKDLDEHNKRLDDPAEQEKIGEDGWLNRDEDINVDCGTNAIVLVFGQSELENHQNAEKTPDDAFTTVFAKDKPGRIRGYGRSMRRTYLEKDEEMNELK
ncbi:hypothetical protein BC332_24026 [Capsicum chinense]|nr:hypothetical protein BC332_24026 [Capsicum chinense]